ncbi:hypothetical protein KC950_03300 [Candidatus Saccharibacteria bacterium]|nr:hypothetical protein [Candidatus Saccharibacteria bacterium]
MDGEKIEFIAERPHIHDNDFIMPWPPEDEFRQHVSEDAQNADTDTNRGKYAVDNELYVLRDEYFRMRYRGAIWTYKKFTGEELPENEPDRLNAFLQHSYWAPAIDSALELYQETGDAKYKTTAVFATGLHIWDALNHSWTFLDPKLANDSAVREKHFLIFLERIHQVSQLDLEGNEKEYFKTMRLQFNLAYAEMAAQSAVSATRDLMIFDNGTNKMNLRPGKDDRSILLSFSDAPKDIQKRVVERFKVGALHAASSCYDHPGYHLEMLHLFGLTSITEYTDKPDYEVRWFKLTAEEILNSDTSRLDYETKLPEQTETYQQDTLF